MAIKMGKTSKAPGDGLIGTGMVFCFLSIVIYLLSSFSGGQPNGSIIFGGGVLGLLMICAGYLKRISVALTAKASAPAEPTSETAH